MSESSLEAFASPVSPPATLTAGAMLKDAREAAGLHVAALAVSMKVPVKKLEALEADRLDLLPDAVFVRALASSVCRALRIDAAPILERLPQTAIPRLDSEQRGINAPFHTAGQQGHTTVGDVMGRPGVLLVAVLMVGALVLVFFPESQVKDDAHEVVVPPSATPNMATPMVIPASATVSEPLAELPAPSVPMPATTPSVPAIAFAPAPAVFVAAPVTSLRPPTGPLGAASAAQQRAGAVNAGPDVAGASGGLVGFSVKGPSWVEVTDAKGVVQLRRTLAAGEKAFASGALPLSVVVGRIDATEVTIRGKPYSLEGLSKDNVARFEVK